MTEGPPERSPQWRADERAWARNQAEARPVAWTSRIADGAGAVGAVLAALCWAGTPFIVAGLSAVGLSFLRRDAILWPLMLASLVVALWGFWQGERVHGRVGPLWLGAAGAVALTAGVIFVHGSLGMQLIYGGAASLGVATLWNLVSRRSGAQRPRVVLRR